MNDILYKNDRIALLSHYNHPQMHRHFAKHIFVSDKPFVCKTQEKTALLNSVIIQSNVLHTVERQDQSSLLVLFIDETSNLSNILDQNYLQEKSLCQLPRKLEKDIVHLLVENHSLKTMDESLIGQICEKKTGRYCIDRRISEAIAWIEDCDCIDGKIYDFLPKKVFLSKSRFLHLFKEDTGIDFKNYILLKKLEKTYTYVIENRMTVTNAAISAGFSSSSHFSIACKKHFGISFTDFIKGQNSV